MLFSEPILSLMTHKFDHDLAQYVLDSFLLEGEIVIIQFLVSMIIIKRATILDINDVY